MNFTKYYPYKMNLSKNVIYNIIYILLYQNQFSLIINKNFILCYILLYFFII